MKIKKTISDEKAFSIIHKPMMTEKSTNLNQFNQYTFVVDKNSNSHEIQQAIEKIFKVKVIKINIINTKQKQKIKQGKLSSKSGYKKAIITLKKGQSIDLTTGL